MTERQYLDRLIEYRTYLEESQEVAEEIGEQESLIGSIAEGIKANPFLKAKKKLEDLFPELLTEPDNQDRWLQEYDTAIDYVTKNHEELRKEYGNKYLAVKGKEVVDSDLDELTLVERTLNDYPKEFVLIDTINGVLNLTTTYI